MSLPVIKRVDIREIVTFLNVGGGPALLNSVEPDSVEPSIARLHISYMLSHDKIVLLNMSSPVL